MSTTSEEIPQDIIISIAAALLLRSSDAPGRYGALRAVSPESPLRPLSLRDDSRIYKVKRLARIPGKPSEAK